MLLLEKLIAAMIALEIVFALFPEVKGLLRRFILVRLVLLPIELVRALIRAWRMTATRKQAALR